jgi:hypothetical protein
MLPPRYCALAAGDRCKPSVGCAMGSQFMINLTVQIRHLLGHAINQSGLTAKLILYQISLGTLLITNDRFPH